MRITVSRLSAIALVWVLFSSCQKELNGDPSGNPGNSGTTGLFGSFSVTIKTRNAVDASISWTRPAAPAGTSLIYKIYFSGSLVTQNLTDTNYVFLNLVANQLYSGRVVAYTATGNDSAFADFIIPIYISTGPGPYTYLDGYYKVTEFERDINNLVDTNNLVFTGRIAANSDSVLSFYQYSRVPATWWGYNYSTIVRPYWGDSLVAPGTTISGRILSPTKLRITYYWGVSTTVFEVQQVWERLANPADSQLYAYQLPADGPGLVKTYAGNHYGNNSNPMSGDGGPALNASLSYPHTIYFDAQQNGYIGDGGLSGSVVRKVNTSGIISLFAGNYTDGYSGDGGPATNAQLHSIGGICSDANGNVYIGDVVNRVIRKVNSSGIISTIAGIPGQPGYSGDGGPAVAAKLVSVGGMRVDAAGNLFFTDVGNNVVRKISAAGIISTVAGFGAAGYGGDGGPAILAKMDFPTGLDIDAQGNIFIADKNNSIIRMVNTSGIISTVAGIPRNDGYSGDGGPATASRLSIPRDVALDGNGNMYICEYGYNRIRKVNSSGIISTIAGNGKTQMWKTGPAYYNGDYGPATQAAIPWPYGLYCSGSLLYVVDGNHRVRKIFL